MAKMTIFVPDDLYARIDRLRRLGCRPNWSQVAVDAFEAVLTEVSKVTKNMTNSTAVLLPVPTTGDFKLFEVRVGSQPFHMKVSRTAMVQKYKNRLDRIVAEFARRVVSKAPSVAPGALLPETLLSSIASEIDHEL